MTSSVVCVIASDPLYLSVILTLTTSIVSNEENFDDDTIFNIYIKSISNEIFSINEIFKLSRKIKLHSLLGIIFIYHISDLTSTKIVQCGKSNFVIILRTDHEY